MKEVHSCAGSQSVLYMGSAGEDIYDFPWPGDVKCCPQQRGEKITDEPEFVFDWLGFLSHD